MAQFCRSSLKFKMEHLILENEKLYKTVQTEVHLSTNNDFSVLFKFNPFKAREQHLGQQFLF